MISGRGSFAGTKGPTRHGAVLASLPLPPGAGGADAAQPAADRPVQLLPGRPQPDRRLLPVERLLRAGLRRGLPVHPVRQVADLRARGQEPRHLGRRRHRDHAGLAVHRGGDRHAHAAAGRRRREIHPGAADRAAPAGADRGLGVPAPAGPRPGRPDPRGGAPAPAHLVQRPAPGPGRDLADRLPVDFQPRLPDLPRRPAEPAEGDLDASRIDGAGPIKRIFAIDIPLLLPQFRIVVILSGIYAVQNFIPILLVTNGGPGTATLVPGLDMYQSAFANDQYGYGMAIGTLLFVVMLVFTLIAMRALRSRTA